jgi:hypothetical protein
VTAGLEAALERVPVVPEPGATGVGGGVGVNHAARGRQRVRIVSAVSALGRNADAVEEGVDSPLEDVDAVPETLGEGLGLRGLLGLHLLDLGGDQLLRRALEQDHVVDAGDPLEEAPGEARAPLEVDQRPEVIGVALVQVADEVLRLLLVLLGRQARERVEEVDHVVGRRRVRVGLVVLVTVPVGIGAVRVVAALLEGLVDVRLAFGVGHGLDAAEFVAHGITHAVEEAVERDVSVVATERLGRGDQGGLEDLEGPEGLVPEEVRELGGGVDGEAGLVRGVLTGSFEELLCHVAAEAASGRCHCLLLPISP